MSWSPEHYPQTGEALLSDLDGVVHGDHHGIGLRLWRNIAQAGLWDTLQNRHGMNGREAEEEFARRAPDDAGFRELDDLAHDLMFDFVQIGHTPVPMTAEQYAPILYETVGSVAREYAHAEVIAEINEIVERSGRPGVFITNSPLTPATLLVHTLFPRTPTLVFSPFDVRLRDGMFSLQVTTPEVRLHKGNFALQVIDDLAIDIEQTTGFGDTESDITLFDTLARPVAINPTKGLRRYAESRGIEIRDLVRPR
jgi:hypothetical protein